MTAPFLALITPIGSGGPVDPGYSPPWAQVPPGTTPRPPGIWGPGDPRPTNPIAGFNPGTGTWPTPTPPQPPLVIWGPGDPRPTLPIAGWNPGSGNFPTPPGIWGGGNEPFPTPPIAEPPWGWGGKPPAIDLPPNVPVFGKVDWKAAWTPATGWIVVGIPAEGTLVPTPSKK